MPPSIIGHGVCLWCKGPTDHRAGIPATKFCRRKCGEAWRRRMDPGWDRKKKMRYRTRHNTEIVLDAQQMSQHRRGRAVWSPEAYRLLKREWWKGTEPRAIAVKLAPMVGCVTTGNAIIAAAAKIKALRSPEALSRVRRAALAQRYKTISTASAMVYSSATSRPVPSPPSPAVAQKIALVSPLWRPASTSVTPKVPYQGLATSGGDPYREMRLRQISESGRGRV